MSTPQGLKPIAEPNKGDYVMSRDELTGQVTAKQITHKFVEWHDDDVREVMVSNGIIETVIITSDEHPFYVLNKGFIPAGELKASDQLVNLDFNVLKVISNKHIEQSMPMYNFEVADYHTYAVSEHKIWVHNNCLTPSGRVVTNHAFTESLERNGFKSLKQIDDIIDNSAKRIAEQSDGALVHIIRRGRGRTAKYDYVVEGEEGIVTGLRELSKEEVKRLAYNIWLDFPILSQ